MKLQITNSIVNRLSNYQIYYVIVFLLIISELSAIYFLLNGQSLLYADAISRLDISRKVIDNITPGIAQLGNVWLPLPQILMLPFIWNSYLWHSGIAGAIMSMSSFIIGGVFIYKSAKLLTNSFLSSFLALGIYALNINIWYLQSTAMSESLFLCTLAASTYYLLMYIKTNSNLYLIPAAIAVSSMTLTRYEGLAILLPSIPLVYFYTFLKTKKYSKAEGTTILYAVLASLGFALWTLYLTVIFGNPLYWKDYYATAQATGGGLKVYSQAKPFLTAVWEYLTATVWMIGLIPVLMALIAIPVMLIKNIKDRSYYFLPLLLPLSIFLFMVLTLQRNTPIVQPELTLKNIFSPDTSNQTGFNIRYGILLLPWVAIMTAYLFNIRYNVLKLLVFAIFAIQVFSYFSPTQSLIYKIPARIYGKPYESLVSWMKQNYDGGFILISASSHEDQIFEMGFNYKTFIHEGTNKYWKESLDDPPHYATWVVLDKGHPEDQVAKKDTIQAALNRDFNLLYNQDQVKVYRIKNRPYFNIPI